MEELDKADLVMELAEQRILRAAEAEAEVLEQRDMNVEVDQKEEAQSLTSNLKPTPWMLVMATRASGRRYLRSLVMNTSMLRPTK